MKSIDDLPGTHSHLFLGTDHDRNERRTWAVVAISAVMMVGEITAGTIFGSMALIADGWHMFTHASALLISALAYRFARRHAGNSRFTFGTGKMGDLAAFASAVILAIISLLIGWDSVLRLANPVEIAFGQATSVAVFGLVVNLFCAWLLGHGGHAGHDDGHKGHGHDHAHEHQGHHAPHANGTDNNMRAA